ncbi:MAG: folylpolyglutamate synthase/dihydrofolate synthase family protein [Kiritimatiellota bacterium]|nr:folylpolyglutamate synthase/dihydrofolate synthase family protein [Kiritimatiellota bacterium]
MTHTVTESLSRLYRLHAAGIKFGLETERALLERLGHPEQGLGIIHVAGTNGKGSVCSMLEAVLRRSGLKTGLYTSPHLIRFNERIRINGRCISDETLAALIPRVDEQAQATVARPGGQEVTFFEFATALAFECFQQEHVDIVVLETGMGGRLDATNVITPLISVITGVSLEHTDYLGKDLPSIAAEKGGIIKPGRPVVIGPLAEETLPVIQRLAQERQARLIQARDVVSVKRKSQNLDGQQVSVESDSTSYGSLRCPLIGRHQLENMGIAVAALEVLRDECGLKVVPQAVKEGLEQIKWPGRCQVLSKEPVTILDGAHNPEGAHILSQVLHELVKGQPEGLVAGLCADKDLDGFLRALVGRIRRVWAVPLRTERSLPPGTIAAWAEVAGCPVTTASVPDALREASAWAAANRGAVCIAGSLYLAGEVLELSGQTESLFD